jgi:hypothetical protein
MRQSVVYLGLTIVGAATALYFGGPYWMSPGAGLLDFVEQSFENAPSATLSADLAVVYLMAQVFIGLEGRRLGMRGLWVYWVLNTVLAVAVGLGLFLWMRDRRLSRPSPSADVPPTAA